MSHLVHRHDIRMVQSGRRSRLTLKSGCTIAVLSESRRQQLQSDLASKLEIIREIDLTHAAARNRPEYLKMSDDAAGFQLARDGLRSRPDDEFDRRTSRLGLGGEQRQDLA